MGASVLVPTMLFGRLGEPAAEAARAFLERNAVPWIDIERDPVADLLAADELAAVRLPLAVFPDGTRLGGPEQWVHRTAGLDRSACPHYRASRQWQAALGPGAGLPTVPEHDAYGVVITGAGPAARDVRHGSVKRAASAAGDGAMAISLVHRFLATQEAPPA